MLDTRAVRLSRIHSQGPKRAVTREDRTAGHIVSFVPKITATRLLQMQRIAPRGSRGQYGKFFQSRMFPVIVTRT